MSVICNLSEDNNDLTISIGGRFDYELMSDFRTAYDKTKYPNYIIDLRETEYIDSSALGMLIAMKKGLADDANISIVNCRPDAKKLLQIARFDQKFNVE